MSIMIFNFLNAVVIYMSNMHMIIMIFHFINAVVTNMSNMHMLLTVVIPRTLQI